MIQEWGSPTLSRPILPEESYFGSEMHQLLGQDDPDKVLSWIQDLNLAYMHLRPEELFGGNEWFGARNILFVGDILQLQSVNGTPIFEKISQKS